MLSVADFVRLHEEGYVRSQSGDEQGAIAAYERALAGMQSGVAYPGVISVRSNLMQCYAAVGQLDDAYEQATRAIQAASTMQDAEKAAVFAQIAWFFCEHAPTDKLEGVLAIADDAIQLVQGEAALAALATKMRLLERLGRDEDAKSVARAALSVDADHPEFQSAKERYGLGRAVYRGKPPSWMRQVDVKGLPPRPTLHMRAAYAPAAKKLFFFGGDKRRADVTTDDEMRQRNAVYALVPDGGDFRWEGPIATEVSDPLENSESAALPRAEHVWTQTANPAWLMAQGGSNQDGRGVTFMDQGGLADWLAFDAMRGRFVELAPPLRAASSLPVLVGHGAAYDFESGRVIVLRAAATEDDLVEQGLGAAEFLSALVFETTGEPTHWTHRRLASRGNGPSVRAGYGVALAGRQLVVFGGAFTRTRSGAMQSTMSTEWPDAVSLLDLDAFHWQTIEPSGLKPEGRIDHAVVALGDQRVLVGGGRRGFGDQRRTLQDYFVLDVRTKRWRRIPVELGLPEGTAWISFEHDGQRRVLAVGGDAEGVPVFEIDVRALLATLR